MKENYVTYPDGEVRECHTPELWLKNVGKCIWKKELLVFSEYILIDKNTKIIFEGYGRQAD